MAKLPALISTLAELDGRERATIEHIARVIREAGHIPTTKRGPGSSEMTVKEAVNLLLGANGCDAPKDAPLAVERFRSLARYGFYTFDEKVPVFCALNDCVSFGSALETMIARFAEIDAEAKRIIEDGYEDGPLKTYLLENYPENESESPFILKVEISRYSALILISVWTGEAESPTFIEIFRRKYIQDMNLGFTFYGKSQYFDRRVTVAFTQKTFRALHNLICGERA